MRVLILGASGRTGLLATSEARQRGHTVTALVRKATSLQSQDGLTVVEGTPFNKSDVEKAFAATPDDPITAVLVTLNAPRETDSPFAKPRADTPATLIQDSVRNTIEVMRDYKIKKIVIMSANGIGSSYAEMPFLFKLVFRTNMRFQMEDHNVVDADMMRISDLDWTLVRPAVLKPGNAKPVKEFGESGKGVGLMHGVTRASVANFMVNAVEENKWVRNAVVVAN